MYNSADVNKQYLRCINNFNMTVENINLDGIDSSRIEHLKSAAEPFREYYFNPNIAISNLGKYSSIVKNIRFKLYQYGIKSSAEILLVVMFAVDPNLEALITFKEYCKIDEAEKALIDKFGFYNLQLVKMEAEYFKHYLSLKEKMKIKEEIDRRSYK